MEIDNSRVATLVTSDSGQGKPVEKQDNSQSGPASGKASTGSSTADSVNLTGQARQLQMLEAQIAREPVVDTQRVQAVHAAVENGTFTINPERIADKMISLEQALTDMR
ncbi:FlgM family anti-sigma-28 factor [Thiogranum longum]|uniref:Negative regulator of flagellin synthesis n=1 Tax=Thiogranum longum TaxID=1537524 RepID=A0A4R1HEW9_9GAMM|nr:flagellar biosynthesis anti-sigma factor FlgM [Thiogranum longum]TCK18875.1 FlgM family anti-sigma-28 factor [Thiogranum longum]